MLTIDLSGRVAFVTGGSRGIGAGITRVLCAAGAQVVFTHTGDPSKCDAVEALRREIEIGGGKAEDIVIDATDSRQTTEAIDRTVERYGRLDVLAPNVGKNEARSAETVTDEDWHRLLDINLGSAFYVVRAALPHMVKQNYGRIIFIGSSAAYDGGGGAIDYAAAKAALNGMTLYLMKNYARKGINTNTVHPCVIETDLLKERYGSAEAKKQLTSQIPVGRLGTPEDVAGMVAYLASPWGDYICGQSFLLDGGRTLGR